MMDTSEQYIKMSFRAWLYLKPLWQWDIGDFFSDGVESGIIVSIHTLKEVEKPVSMFPLPRQDQLQEIAGTEKQSALNVLQEFYMTVMDVVFSKPDEKGEFAEIHSLHEWVDFPGFDYQKITIEQLWLLFVMKNRFNKTWNGEDWV